MSDESVILNQAVESIESQRAAWGDSVADAALLAVRERLAAIKAKGRDISMQRKLVTVLFADVSGFTALVETLDPEDVTTTMNALWSRIDGAILAEGGTIDKHIGDAVMALFGAPVAREDDPEHAVRAALAMQEQLREFVKHDEEHADGKFKNLKMRIGVNTGLVLVGPVGTTNEYTALGDTVNTASRLEHAAPVGGVLIAHSTYQHVRGVFELDRLEPISVKGKREPIQIYEVHGIRPRAFRVTTRGVVGVETPTVGREDEMALLEKTFKAAVREKQARAVTVVADAGTGKSRLLYEFGRWLDDQPQDFRLFKGRSTEDMARLPYSLVRDLFVFQFEIQESDRGSVARQKLEDGIRAIIGDENADQIPFIGQLIGFDYSNHPALRGVIGEARQLRDRAFYYLAQMFKQVLNESPLVIYLEDLHWADMDSVSVIEHVIDECRDLPLLVIALARATLFERRESWGMNEKIYTRLDLEPLNEEAIRTLVSAILQRLPAIPESIYEMVLQRADGNPFYVEEVIKMMIEEGIIITGEEAWALNEGRLAELKVPATLTGVLQARLDGLATLERKTLQRASVLGRIFWDTALPRLQDVAGDELQVSVVDDYLELLQTRELVFERDASAFGGSNEYIFKHAILRDVTYESVLLQIRRVYHAQAAVWLIERSGERIDEFAGRIGEHYEKAEQLSAAAEWYARAGKQANATYSAATAAELFQKALELWQAAGDTSLKTMQLKIKAYDGLGEALAAQGQLNEAIDAYTHMRDTAEQIDDREQMAQALVELAGTHIYYKGDVRAGLEGAQEAEQVARAANADEQLATALQIMAWAKFRLGEPDEAQALGEQSLEASERVETKQAKGRTLNLLGVLNLMRGRFDRASAHLAEALDVFEEMGNKGEMIHILNNLGFIAESIGDYGEAYGRYDTAIKMAKEVGDRNAEITFISNRGSALVGLGHHDEALVDLMDAINSSEGQGFSLLGETYRNLARVHLAKRNPAEALKAAQRSIELGHEFEMQDNVGGAWRVLGQIASHLGEPISVRAGGAKKAKKYTAEECFQESLDIFTSMDMEGELARTKRAWARHEILHGEASKGQALWNEARETFQRLGALSEAERMSEIPQS